ncbi:MAG: hypothetical protein ACRDF0_11245 [Candidatus Limnocylindria bacterium]
MTHLANFHLLGGREMLDVNAEGGVFAWASATAIWTAALAAAALAVTRGGARREGAALAAILAFFSLDEAVGIHERILLAAVGLTGLPSWTDSLLLPVIYLPIFALAVVLLLRLGRGTPAVRRSVRLGIALLAAAVMAEAGSAPWSDPDAPLHPVHVWEGALEEALEIAGWILIASGLAAVFATGFRDAELREPPGVDGTRRGS